MERSKKRVLHVVLLVMMMGLGLVSWAAEAQENNILEALKVSDPPKLDGMADAQWEKAKPLAIKVIDGANLPGGETDVTLRARKKSLLTIPSTRPEMKSRVYWSLPS